MVKHFKKPKYGSESSTVYHGGWRLRMSHLFCLYRWNEEISYKLKHQHAVYSIVSAWISNCQQCLSLLRFFSSATAALSIIVKSIVEAVHKLFIYFSMFYKAFTHYFSSFMHLSGNRNICSILRKPLATLEAVAQPLKANKSNQFYHCGWILRLH